MENEFLMCRVCTDKENIEKLVPIFEKSNKIATEIFLVSGVKILEFSKFPALICARCVEELTTAMVFRDKCRQSDKFFRKSYSGEESLFWNSFQYESELASDNCKVKQECGIDGHRIKDEPYDDFHVDLFENIDTILEENFNESSSLASILKKAKRETNSSESDAEYEARKKRKLKSAMKRSASEFRDFDLCPTNGVAQCKLCYKSFTSLHSMKDHMRAIHQKLDESDMYKCPHCDRLFKMKYYLNRHIKSYHLRQLNKKEKRTKPKLRFDGDEIFKEKLVGLNCPYCNKFLTSKHSLNDHIRVRHEFINYSERFLCDICGKDFPLKYYLLRHIRASHLKTLSYKKKNEDHLPCSICGKILKSKGNLSTHEKTHRILAPNEYWYCDICGNKFKGRGEMTVHIKKRHLYKIRYPCEICPPGKSWRTLFQLQRHVKVFHHNIREFKCEWCGKEFGEKNKLVCHVRIHTGEQPFRCNFAGCSRAFTHQTDLRRHVWGHTGERPYKCTNPSCLKGFMKKSELTAHETRCHPSARPNMQIPFQYQMM